MKEKAVNGKHNGKQSRGEIVKIKKTMERERDADKRKSRRESQVMDEGK